LNIIITAINCILIAFSALWDQATSININMCTHLFTFSLTHHATSGYTAM